MPSKIKEVICYYLLLPAAVIGSTKTDCTVAGRGNLICSFPFNVNSTQRDYGVYFYPDDGGEEPLLDCAWIKSQLRCIKQRDIEYNHQVSTLAEITIPKSFVDRSGSYKCVPEGHRRHTIKSCRFPEERYKDIVTSCDAKVTLDEQQAIINCSFSSPIESFIVKKKTIVMGSFTKSVCQNFKGCQYSPNGKGEVFSLILDVAENPYDEYFCHSDQSSQQAVIKGCTPTSYKRIESSIASVLAGILPSAASVIVVAVAACVLYR